MEGSPLDTLFQAAVSAMDRGDMPTLATEEEQQWLLPGCGGIIAGMITHPRQRWDAEKRYLQQQRTHGAPMVARKHSELPSRWDSARGGNE